MTHTTTPQEVYNLLPEPPEGGYTYEVVVVSPRVIRVDLVFPHMPYQDKTPRTPYAFIKGDKVYPPQNMKVCKPEHVCTLLDLYKQPSYSTVVPKVRSLLHIK